MSELKVVVDGKEREIRGVHQETTTEGIVLVLAKATGKTGKLALVEKWRDSERILPSDECPLKCLHSWGCYRDDVSLVLQDDHSLNSNDFNKDAINLDVDDKDYLLARSLDWDSQEDFTALQKRKLQRLTRAIEILDLQANCWDSNDEAFLYLTDEEIAEDLEGRLSKTLKLQAKELVEFETWENELRELEQTRENLSRQRDIFAKKIADLEERIAEAYDAIDLLLEDLEKAGKNDIEFDNARNEFILQELEQISKELSQQNALFRKQDHELALIKSTILNLERDSEEKNNQVSKLKQEVELYSNDFQIAENFLPKMPEAETTLQSADIRPPVKDIESNFNISGLEDQVDNKKIKSPLSKNESVSTRTKDNDVVDTESDDRQIPSQKFTSGTLLKQNQDKTTSEKGNSKTSNSKDNSISSSLFSSLADPAKNVAPSFTKSHFITSSKHFPENTTKVSSESFYTNTSPTDTSLKDTTSLSDGFSSDTSVVSNSPQISTSLSNSPEEEISSALTSDSFAVPEYVLKNPETDCFSNLTSGHYTAKQVSLQESSLPPTNRNTSSLKYSEHDSTDSPKQNSTNPLEYSTKPSQSCAGRKESFKKIREVFEKQEEFSFPKKDSHSSDVTLRKSFFEKKEGVPATGDRVGKFSKKQECPKEKSESFTEHDMNKSSKPVTFPKPIRNNAMAPHLENTTQPLQEKFSFFNNSITRKQSHSKKTLIAAPKPYGTYVANLGTSSSKGNLKVVEKPDESHERRQLKTAWSPKTQGNFETSPSKVNNKAVEKLEESHESKSKTTPKTHLDASFGTRSSKVNIKAEEKPIESHESKSRTTLKEHGNSMASFRTVFSLENSKVTGDYSSEAYGSVKDVVIESSSLQHKFVNTPHRPYSVYGRRSETNALQENKKQFGETCDDSLESKNEALELNALQNDLTVASNSDVTLTDSSSEQDESIVSNEDYSLNLESTQKKSKLLAKPYRNHTSTTPLSPLMKSKLALAQSRYSRNHLSPPTAAYNRKHIRHKQTAMISNGEATEPGIFV